MKGLLRPLRFILRLPTDSPTSYGKCLKMPWFRQNRGILNLKKNTKTPKEPKKVHSEASQTPPRRQRKKMYKICFFAKSEHFEPKKSAPDAERYKAVSYLLNGPEWVVS